MDAEWRRRHENTDGTSPRAIRCPTSRRDRRCWNFAAAAFVVVFVFVALLLPGRMSGAIPSAREMNRVAAAVAAGFVVVVVVVAAVAVCGAVFVRLHPNRTTTMTMTKKY